MTKWKLPPKNRENVSDSIGGRFISWLFSMVFAVPLATVVLWGLVAEVVYYFKDPDDVFLAKPVFLAILITLSVVAFVFPRLFPYILEAMIRRAARRSIDECDTVDLVGGLVLLVWAIYYFD